MTTQQRSTQLKQLAHKQGFERVGITSAAPLARADYIRAWVRHGHAGEMSYLAEHLDKKSDPAQLLEGARSVAVCALNYYRGAHPVASETEPTGRVARYAWGRDYHKVIKKKLLRVIDNLRTTLNEPFEAKACVDTAPITERELAMRAGIGWIGKNTMVLNQGLGSYFFLGEIVTTLDLEPDCPATDHCGSCTRCLEACPTDAFPRPYQMDARRCISYQTIELRSDIPEEFHTLMGDWIFGCDICQEVCPFNADIPRTQTEQFLQDIIGSWLSLDQVASWNESDYQKALAGSATKRARLDMLKRNARIVGRNLSQA